MTIIIIIVANKKN